MPCGKCGAPQIRSAGRLFAAALGLPESLEGCNALADTGPLSVRFEPAIVNGLLVKLAISLKSLDVAEPIDVAAASRQERHAHFFSTLTMCASSREGAAPRRLEAILGGVADLFTVGAVAPTAAIVCRGHDRWQKARLFAFGATA